MTHWTERHRVVSAVYVLLRRDDTILCLRRANTGYQDGNYSLPAGHVDGGESAVAAMVREAKEEVGVNIEPGDMTFSTVMHRMEGNEEDERVDFFVHVHQWQGEPFNAEPEKCDDLRWVDLRQLPLNVVPYVRRALGNHLAHVPFDEFGD